MVTIISQNKDLVVETNSIEKARNSIFCNAGKSIYETVGELVNLQRTLEIPRKFLGKEDEIADYISDNFN